MYVDVKLLKHKSNKNESLVSNPRTYNRGKQAFKLISIVSQKCDFS